MKKILTVFFIFSSVIVRADSWTQKANFPGTGIDYPFSFSIGTKGYVGCGEVTSEFWEYDPAIDAWTQKADFGGPPRWVGTGFSIGNKGYGGLGTDASTAILYQDFWEYDTTANAWTQKANFAGPARYSGVGFSIGNFGYVCTGGSGGITYNDLWMYDPANDLWTQKTSMPGVAREEASGFAIGLNGYVLCGFDPTTAMLQDVWEYNSVSDSWAQKATFPGSARCDAGSFAICDKGYIGTGDPCFCVDFWQYTPATDSWIQKASFGGTGRDEPAALSIGNKGYIGLGQFSDFWEYAPDSVSCNLVAAFTAANHICPGTCTNFTNISINATSYLWTFAGATPTTSTDENPTGICYNTPGNYSVSLIASNFMLSDTLTLNNYITVYPFPAPQGIAQSGDTLFANQGAVSYQWYYSGNAIAGATDYFYLASQSGDYNVVATDANHCEVEAAIFDVLASVQPAISDMEMAIYPNPVGNKCTIYDSQLTMGTAATITIYNMLGEKVLAVSPLSLGRGVGGEADVHELSSGIYFLQIKTNGKSYQTKFIKQ